MTKNHFTLFTLHFSLSSGQALVEALVAIGVAVVLVTGLIVGTTNSLKAGQFSRNKSQASKFAQEGIEITRALRDGGWDNFFTYADNTWCLDGNGAWTQINQGQQCTPPNINNFFSRKIIFTWTDPKMVVVATVSWRDGPNTHQSEITTYFTEWR